MPRATPVSRSAADGAAAVRLASFVDRVVAPTGFTRLQLRLLRLLADGPAFGVGLARRLAVRGPNLSVMVDNLVERGFIDRAVDEVDRRRNRYTLTASGRSALRDAESAIGERLDTALALLPAGDAAAARRGLGLVQQALDLDVTRLLADRDRSKQA